MNRSFSSLRLWVVGLLILGGSLAGASRMLRTHADDGSSQESPGASPVADKIEGAVCIGHVDVEDGVRGLYPSQPGRVQEVLVHEDDLVKAGTALLRLDERPARFLVRQAEADLQAAQLHLTDARKLPEQHRLKLAEQRSAMAVMEHRLAAARHVLTRKRNLQNNQQLAAEEADAAAELVKELEAACAAEQQKLRELELADPQVDLGRAAADVSAKQARLEQARYALDECCLRAPAEGKVLRLLVGAGDLLGAQPRQPAIQFCPNTPRIVRAEVEQEFAGRVSVGQSASIQDDSRAGPLWHGKVTRISDWYTQRRSVLLEPLQFNDVRTLECIIALEPTTPAPRIGQRVRVTLGQR